MRAGAAQFAFATGFVFALMAAGAPLLQGQKSSHVVDQVQIDRWKEELSNWGRWGPNDQKGTLNLITPLKRRQAATLVQEGVAVSLARDIVPEKDPKSANALGFRPWVQGFRDTNIAAYDWISGDFHGLTITHFDALDHHFYSDGRMYNGYQHKDFFTVGAGPTKSTVINAKAGVFTRGILMDMPRLKRMPYLDPGTPIYIEDLEAWEKQAGVRVSAGDAIFIRTGRWTRLANVRVADAGSGDAGLDASVIPWLKQRDVAVLATESAGLSPKPDSQRTTKPEDGTAVHNFALVALGLAVLDDCDLDAVSEAASQRNRWEFLVTIAPLPLVSGTGSPINPLAVF
jgi:hypothetical protein